MVKRVSARLMGWALGLRLQSVHIVLTASAVSTLDCTSILGARNMNST